MEENKKYFDNINGIYVKDSEAREDLSSIETTILNEVSETYATKTEVENVVSNVSETYATKTELSTQISGVTSDIELINSNDTIFLGDSYADGTTYESGSLDHVPSWCDNLKDMLGLTEGHYYIFSQGGGGFAHENPSGDTFIDLLENNIESITNKENIKNIIVCAGYNDNDQTYSDLIAKIEEFSTYCKGQFPNATLYLGMIGGSASDTSNGANIRSNLLSVVLRAFMDITKFGGVYLSGVENFTHNFKMFDPQGNHPTEEGYKLVAKLIYNAFKNGYGSMYIPYVTDTLTLVDNSSTVNISGSIHNNNKTIIMGNVILNDVNISVSSSEVTIVNSNTDNNICKPNASQQLDIPCDIWFKDGSNNNHFTTGKIQFKNDGSIIINSTYFAINGGTITTMAVYPTIITAETLIS